MTHTPPANQHTAANVAPVSYLVEDSGSPTGAPHTSNTAPQLRAARRIHGSLVPDLADITLWMAGVSISPVWQNTSLHLQMQSGSSSKASPRPPTFIKNSRGKSVTISPAWRMLRQTRSSCQTPAKLSGEMTPLLTAIEVRITLRVWLKS